MKSKSTVIVLDLDGVICEERPTFERSLAARLPGAADTIARWKIQGHRVIIYTSRSWAEYEMTAQWLCDNGIEYDTLICGKPVADIWIDDRAIKFKDWEVLRDAI